MKSLPPQAQCDTFTEGQKSYTLSDESEASNATISIILNKGTLYVRPVHALPTNQDGIMLDMYKINKQHGVQVRILPHPFASWKSATILAGWPQEDIDVADI